MKLTYEDCKELKDAGYPMGESDEVGIGHVPNLEARIPHGAYFTGISLSELIEACGEHALVISGPGLSGYAEGWLAVKHLLQEEGMTREQIVNLRVQGRGLTPEQAVKNLWLQLNKNLH